MALVIGIFLYFRNFDSKKILGTTSDELSPSPIKNSFEFDFKGQKLTVGWFEVFDTTKLNLTANFKEKLAGKEIIYRNSCNFLVSAGFYSKDEKPIGLFISDGKTLSSWQKNPLFNGIFSVNYLDTPRITRELPADPLRIAVQAGPLLKENASYLKLSLKNDGPERRVLVATTGENKTLFLVVYSNESVFVGPKLSDLPEVLKIFEEKAEITLADALNLDGGTASVFYSKDVSLEEASSVGAFFCLKN